MPPRKSKATFAAAASAPPAAAAAAAPPAAAGAAAAAAATPASAVKSPVAAEIAKLKECKKNITEVYRRAVQGFLNALERTDAPNVWKVSYNANELYDAHELASEALGLTNLNDPRVQELAHELLLGTSPPPFGKPLLSFATEAKA